MIDINLREYYPVLLRLDPFITHKMLLTRTALNAFMETECDRYKRILISKELKKPFLQKLFEMKGAV